MGLTGAQIEKALDFDLQDKRQQIDMIQAKAAKKAADSNYFKGEFVRSGARYAMLFTIIILLFFLAFAIAGMVKMTQAASRMTEAQKAKIRSQNSWWSRLKRWFSEHIGFLLKPSYRVRLFFRMFVPFRGNEQTIPRIPMSAGRCDHLNWIQDTPEGTRGFCFSAVRPRDIEWTLDMSKMPEYFELPEQRKKQMETQLKVRIPYSEQPQDSFFVPQCDKAIFADSGKPAEFFEDTGTTCRLRELPSKAYNPMARKSKTSLDDLQMI